MVDQVEVTNVGADGGSNGIASEVTLERLAATMERMSKQQGADGAATVKKLNQLNQELENGINVSTQYQDAISENTDQVEENTEAVEESTDAHRTLADTMLGVFMGALGTVAGSLKGLTSELVFGGDQVSDFAQHMPMIGELLKPVAGYLDDTMDTFRELRTIGGSLGNDLMEFRRSTAEMYLSMDEFTSFMKDNSESIAAYGGTVTGGIRELRLMNSALGEHREDLLNMGFTFEDMNDALSHYMYLNRTGQMIERRSRDEQAAAAAEYAKNLDRLSKLTGQDVDAMRQRLVEEQNNIAVQRELAKMSDEQRDTWNEAYASMSTFSSSAGELMRQMLNSQGPLSESSRVLASLAPQAHTALQDFVDGIKSGEIDVRDRAEFERAQSEAISNFLVGIDNAGHDLESVLDAVAASEGEIDGPAAKLAEIINDLGIDLSQYRDKSGKINAEMLEESLKRSRAEQDERAETTEALAAFDEAIRGMRQTIKVAIIDSGVMESFSGGVNQLAEYIKSDEFQDSFKEVADRLTTITSNILTIATDGDFNGMWTYITSEAGPLVSAVEEAAGNLGNKLGDAFYDAITNPKVLGGIAVGLTAAMGSMVVASAIGKAFGNIFSGGGRSGGAIGGAIGGIGKGTGTAISGISRGLMVAGGGAKLVTLGAAAIAGAIAIIGGAVAGATWMVGKSLPSLASGLKDMSEVDGERLGQVGNGMKSFGVGLMSIGGGGIAQSFADAADLIMDGIYALFGKDRSDVFDKLEEFTSKEVNMDRLRNNAMALVLFTETMNRIPTPTFAEAVSGYFTGFFDTSSGLFDKLTTLSKSEEVNLTRLQNNAKALVLFTETMNRIPTPTFAEAVSGYFTGFFDTSSGLFDKLTTLSKSEEVNLTRLQNNAKALVLFTETMNQLHRPKFTEAASEFFGSFFDGSGDLFENLKTFSDQSIDQESIRNLGGFTSKLERLSDIDPGNLGDYTTAIQELVEALRDLNEELKEGGTGPFGGRSGPNLGDLIQNINNTNTASSEGMDRVSSLLSELLTVIRSDTELSRKIEKNTRSIQTTNLVRNPSSF